MDLVTLAMAKAYSDSKGGYVEPGKTILDVKLMEVEGICVYESYEIRVHLEVGKTYTVTLDSGAFSAVCKEGLLEGSIVCFLGNAIIVGGEDTGEPFFVCSDYVAEAESVHTLVVDMNGGTKCVIATAETIVPIDPKFLPGVNVPIVANFGELGLKVNDVFGHSLPLTNEIVEMAKKAFAVYQPIYLLFPNEYEEQSGSAEGVTCEKILQIFPFQKSNNDYANELRFISFDARNTIVVDFNAGTIDFR